MKKITKKIINKISKIDIDYKKERVLKKIISNDRNIKYIDTFILVNDHNVKIRLFIPKVINQTIIYFHGGGFVTGDIHTYSKTCYDLANNTNSLVISVNYRLAPEYPFPNGLIDCYNVTKYLYSSDSFLDNKSIIIMGDSAEIGRAHV